MKALVANPAFSRKISQPAVAEYLRWGYVPAPLSIFENTYKVKPGHYLILNNSFQISDHEYWAIEARGDRFPSHIEERSLEEVRDLMASAFSYRMVSDVPVGLFLSGGIDSSLVAAVLRKEANYPLTTFTLGFKEPAYDESSWARRVASV
ncbi:MAG: asparagine synthetase B, partial [Acidobacteria bacterium]